MTRIDQSEGEKIRLRRANEKTFFSTNALNFVPSNGIVANLDESRIRKTNNLKKLEIRRVFSTNIFARVTHESRKVSKGARLKPAIIHNEKARNDCFFLSIECLR